MPDHRPDGDAHSGRPSESGRPADSADPQPPPRDPAEMEKWRRRAETDRRRRRRDRRMRTVAAAALGGPAAAGFLAAMGPADLDGLLVAAAWGAAALALMAWNGWGHLVGVFLYGAGLIVVSWFLVDAGIMEFRQETVFFAWLVLLCLSAVFGLATLRKD